MKNQTILFTILPFIFAFIFDAKSQENRIPKISEKIKWQAMSHVPGPDGKATDFLICEDCGVSNESFKTPLKSHFIMNEHIGKATIKTSKWLPIQFWEFAGVDTLGSLQIPSIQHNVYEIEKKIGTRVQVKLIRKEKGVWEKLDSYELDIQSSKLNVRNISTNRISTTDNSILSQGQWVKMGVVSSGVYALKVSDLAPHGLNLSGKQSSQIKMFGSGGKVLSEARNSFKFKEMDEIAIQVNDGGDGVFGENDQILFYGRDPNTWTLNKATSIYNFSKNIYSDTSYYFITFSEGAGKRISTQTPPIEDALIERSSYRERWVYAPDNINVRSIGREWYADVLDFTPNKIISFEANGLLTDSAVNFRIGLMARSSVSYPFKVNINGASSFPNLIPATVTVPGSATTGNYGSPIEGSTIFKPASGSNSLNVSVLYDKKGNFQSQGYINFIEATGWRSLVWRNANFGFRSNIQSGNVVRYFLPSFPSNGSVWNVSNPSEIESLVLNDQKFKILEDEKSEFFAFRSDAVSRPVAFKQVNNQSLISLSVPDLLIVAHPNFFAEANRLANFRRNFDGLDVEVVSPEQIYNEFSSGSQDITAIRNFAMHLYYKGNDQKFKYLLLFGDCSYDYKNRISNNTNFVPVYESLGSMNLLSSFASDDYYGILSKTGGNWQADDNMEIGVGRLPVKSAQEAKAVVDKLIHYASSTDCYGDWRAKYTFVADDGDGGEKCLHSDQANGLSGLVQSKNRNSTIKKIFIGAYEQIASPGGYTSPNCTNDLINTIQKGTLVLNYTGHGGETVWADEFIFTSEMVSGLQNKNNLPFFITATCDFGRHDYPSQTSGAETLVLNQNGGAIGIMTTGRPVDAYSNYEINKNFYKVLYNNQNGRYGRMGEVHRLTKNTDPSKSSNKGFSLLGDPSAKFAFPEQEVVVSNIAKSDTIKGLELVKLAGEVRANGIKNSAFNGKAEVVLFDRPNILSVKGTNTSTTFCNYPYQKNILYSGSVDVKSGGFVFNFFVSKDVSFQVDSGKMVLYARSIELKKDAIGSENVLVGGLNTNPRLDNQGPQIKLFMNDTSFVDYGLVGTNADLLVFLRDDSSGINVAGLGMGHDLTATLDGNEVYILNEYFQNLPGSYSEGGLVFPLRGLSPGPHQIVVKVWDSFNNSSEMVVNFTVGVSEVNGLIVKELKIYPNPSTGEVFLELENSNAGNNIEIQLVVYDIVGHLLTEKVWDYSNSIARPGAFKELAWDGNKPDGTKLPAGTYFCKINVKSNTDGAEYKINKKIILIR